MFYVANDVYVLNDYNDFTAHDYSDDDDADDDNGVIYIFVYCCHLSIPTDVAALVLLMAYKNTECQSILIFIFI